MKSYISLYEKTTYRDGDRYYVLRSISIEDCSEINLLFPLSSHSIKKDTLYRVDINDKECHTLVEISSWESFNEEVISRFSEYRQKEEKETPSEKCARAIVTILDNEINGDNKIIEQILDFNSKEDIDGVGLFKCDFLIAIVRTKQLIAWAIEKAKILFPKANNEVSFFTDVEKEVYECIRKHKNVKFWEEAIIHDPEIVEFASNQKDKDEFISNSPLENMNDILSREGYRGYYSQDQFMQMHEKILKEHAKELIKFLNENTVIFDLEGNSDTGRAWEYYIKSLDKKLKKPFERKFEDDGRYHHITEEEWKPFDENINRARIIIGHNIKRHDCILLNNRCTNSIYVTDDKIWDTLEIEAILNPSRDTYALVVPHKAKEDVQVIEKLFWTQLRRILANENDYIKVRDFLPKCLIEFLQTKILPFEKAYISASLEKGTESPDDYFYKYRHFHFPEYITIENNTLIVTPKRYWKDLVTKFENVSFLYNDEVYDEFAYLNKEKVALLYSSSNNGIERALYYYVTSREKTRVCSIPDYFLNHLGIKNIYQLIDTDCIKESASIFCTDSFNLLNHMNIIPVSIRHVIFMNIEEDGLLGGKKYSKLGHHEQNDFITSIKQRGSYSKYKKRLSISQECLTSIVTERDIGAFSFWAFQPDIKTLNLMCFVNHANLVETVRNKIHGDISEEEWYSNTHCEDNISYASWSGITFRMPSTIEANREIYWRQQYEIITEIDTVLPKVWILDTNNEVEEVCSFIKIKKSRIGGYHSKAYRILEKAAENPSKVCVISWEDILLNKRTIDLNFCFFINDISRFISVNDLSNDIYTEVSNTIKALNFIKDKLLTFGFGSDIVVIDPIFETHKYLLPQIFGFDRIHEVSSDTQYVEKESNNKFSYNEYEKIVSWIELESKLLFNATENIAYYLSDIQKIAIKKHCIYKGSIKNFLTVIPTGGGKSVIFQGPLLYDAIKNNCKKLSIVITPLQALMQDQVDEIVNKNKNIYNGRVAYIHSGVSAAKQIEVIKAIKHKEITLLYISPERLLFSHFFNNTISFAAANQGIDTIIFDEAHCITSWGTDFRPSYLLALEKCIELQERNPEISIQMFTATMSAQSEEDLRHFINLPKENIVPCEDSLDSVERESYSLSLCPIRNHINLTVRQVEQFPSRDQLGRKVAEMWSIIADESFLGEQNLLNGTSRAIIFTKSRKDSREGVRILKEILHGSELENKIAYFHAKLSDIDKVRIAEDYKSGKICILFSTKAFGLGMNVKNIHFVGHLTPPTFIEDYLQEVGRAGRDVNLLPPNINPINAVCIYTKRDIDNIRNYDGGLKWEDISQAFEAIKQYINNFRKGNSRNYYAVPLNLLSRDALEDESDTRIDSDSTKFMQSLAWLSDPLINRIHLGFYCSDVYELKFIPEKKGLLKGSAIKNLYDYAYRKYKANDDCDYIVLRANEIIANPIFDVNSPEECDILIEACINCGCFARDYMYVGVTINKGNKNYVLQEVKSFYEDEKNNPLKALFILINMLKSPLDDLFDESIITLTEKLKKQVSDSEKDVLHSIINTAWEYSLALVRIYSLSEIQEKSEKLIKILYSNIGNSMHLLKLMKELDINDDVDELKAFVLLLHKLNYVNKSNIGLDYIEISFINENSLNDRPQNLSDANAKKYFDNIVKAKKDRADAMSNLITNFTCSVRCKEEIKEYSRNICHSDDDLRQK